MSRTHSAAVPADAVERVRAELEPDSDVVSVMLLNHPPGTEPTTFKPGVLEIVLRDDAKRRAAGIAGQARAALGEWAGFVPVVCLTLSEHGEHPLRLRGGWAVVPWSGE